MYVVWPYYWEQRYIETEVYTMALYYLKTWLTIVLNHISVQICFLKIPPL